jgi:uncharacterized Zn finger protein
VSFHDFQPPRRVEGGIRARSARGAIGESWWSLRFLAVLESFALGTRLTRGRSYARAGQVLALDIAPGLVTASVQGSRPTPYQVRIGLTPYPELTWAKIEIALAEQALYSADLLAGELPHDLEPLLQEMGVPLFPAAVRDLDMRCSCPDAAVPCKHLAATFYLLAEAFDGDPFQILWWRGRSRQALLDRLRTLRADGPADRAMPAAVRSGLTPTPAPTPAPTSASVGAVGAALALADLPELALSACLDRFWVAGQPLDTPPTTADPAVDLLLRQLPSPGPNLGGPGLVERLRPAYHRFATPDDED